MYVSFSINLLYHEQVSQAYGKGRMSALKRIKFFLFSIIILLGLIFVYFVTYNFVEPKAYDFMIKHALTEKLPFHNKQIYGSDDIILVVIDANTVEKYRWPWKRELNCKIYEYFLNYAHPKIIVHDSIIATLDTDNPDSDKKFFNTLSKFNNVVVGFMPSVKSWADKDFGEIYDKAFIKFSARAEDRTTSMPYFYSSIMPFPKPYFDVVKNAGSVSMLPGFINGNISSYAIDQVFRNHEYFLKYNGKIYPSVAMKAFLMMNKNPEMVLTNNSITFPQLNYRIKQKTTPYQSIVPLKFYKLAKSGYSHPKISAVDIMDSYDNIKQGKKPVVDPSVFDGKVIVIGANVPAGTGLNDNKNTPIVSNHPGVDIQATAIDNIIHNDFLNVIPAGINLLITFLGMLIVYGIIRMYDLFKSITSSIAIIAAYLVITYICFYFGTVINVITPVVMFIVTMLIAYTHKFVLENRSKEKVKSAMGKYMSEDVMKRVIMNIDNLGLGGKKATVTVLFADIRGFTSMSETMSAQQVSEILNEYFTEMEPIITKYNGIINKFIGDAVMAIFGEPIQDKNHASNAVRCGYEMLQKVKELQKKWAAEGKPKIEIGIGINTGEVFVGNIGSVNRMEYTVIGDTVNLASRLESYNKVYKTKMLISSSTYAATKSFIDVIKISDVEIRGKSHKMNIYEVLKVI